MAEGVRFEPTVRKRIKLISCQMLHLAIGRNERKTCYGFCNRDDASEASHRSTRELLLIKELNIDSIAEKSACGPLMTGWNQVHSAPKDNTAPVEGVGWESAAGADLKLKLSRFLCFSSRINP